MTENSAKTSANARTRVQWKLHEQILVFKAYKRMHDAGVLESKAEDSWSKAQNVLPTTRHRLFYSSTASQLLKLYVIWAAEHPEVETVPQEQPVPKQKADGSLDFNLDFVFKQAPAPLTPKHSYQPPVHKIAELPFGAPQTFDVLFKRVVDQAVRSEMDKYRADIEQMLLHHQQTVEAMLHNQYGRLMAYWAGDAAALSALMPQPHTKVEPSKNYGSPPAPAKPHQKKVFVCGIGPATMESLRQKMPNVHFVQGEGNNPRSIPTDAHYDLVIAAKMTRHAASGVLEDRYGEKFKYIRSGDTTLISTLRDYFGAHQHDKHTSTVKTS